MVYTHTSVFKWVCFGVRVFLSLYTCVRQANRINVITVASVIDVLILCAQSLVLSIDLVL